MLRHRLAALFEPRSLLVVGDRALPVTKAVPAYLQARITVVDVVPGRPLDMPGALRGMQADERLDQVLLCVPSVMLPDALVALKPWRPRSLILLQNDRPSSDPIEEMAYCRAWGRMNDCLVLGPRSFGVQRPHLGLNLSHERQMAVRGRVALVAQSRSITSAVLDWAEDIQLGFSTVVSLGDESVVDVSDVLDYLAMDPRSDSIALYLEETSSSRRFTSALRAAAGVKPVVVLKAGHGAAEPQTAQDAVFNALLRRAGAVRVRYFVQLFSALKVLAHNRRPKGQRIALFSNGSGAAQLALDVMGPNAAVHRADLSMTTAKELATLLEPGAAVDNPVVTYAPMEPAKVEQALRLLDADPGVDGVLVLVCPDPLSDLTAVAQKLSALAADARKPLVTCFLGDADMRPLRHLLDTVGTPSFRTPESAANAFGILASYHYNQTLAQQTLPPEPLGKPPQVRKARSLLTAVRQEDRRRLTLRECQDLFDCFHVPVQVRDGTHDAQRPDSAAMAIRVRQDPHFGPYIVFGAGGDENDVPSGYRAIDLPPLNRYLARELIERSSLWRRVLSRQLTPVALEHLQETLERLSELVSELPDLDTLSLKPLVAEDMQLVASGVSVRLRAEAFDVLPEVSRYRHMAIHPYPRHLVRNREFPDGQAWTLRPIRPEDAVALQEFIRGLSEESRYMRFVSMLRELTPRMLARYTRIDYDRELALVATVQIPNPEHRGHPREAIVGFAHYLRNADGRGAEYALVIGDAWQRRGLGAQLMRSLIDAARDQGLTYIDGLVLASNRAMLSLMSHLGFINDRDEEDPTMRRVWLDLGETAS